MPKHFLRVAARRSVLFAAFVAISMLCGTEFSRAQSKAEITIDNFTFAPAELKIFAGTTVTWINHDDIPHSVVEENKQFRSKALDTGDSYSFTFARAGNYDYFCGLHPHMTGKIIVAP